MLHLQLVLHVALLLHLAVVQRYKHSMTGLCELMVCVFFTFIENTKSVKYKNNNNIYEYEKTVFVFFAVENQNDTRYILRVVC